MVFSKGHGISFKTDDGIKRGEKKKDTQRYRRWNDIAFIVLGNGSKKYAHPIEKFVRLFKNLCSANQFLITGKTDCQYTFSIWQMLKVQSRWSMKEVCFKAYLKTESFLKNQ